MFDRTAAAERLQRIRLPVRRIAEQAGLHHDAVHKLLDGKVDPRESTIRAFEQALEAEELALRDYLNALHPPVEPAPQSRAAVQAFNSWPVKNEAAE